MGAPGLVDDQRHAPLVRDLGQRAHVRRRRRSRSARRSRRRRRRASAASARGERLRGQAVGDPELCVELRARQRWDASRTGRARRSCSSGRCAGRSPRSPRWASARPAARLPCEAPLTRNQARARAPRLGRERLRLVERPSARGRGRRRRSGPGCRAPAPARRGLRAAPRRRPGRPCDPGRAAAPGRAGRSRRERRDRGSRPGSRRDRSRRRALAGDAGRHGRGACGARHTSVARALRQGGFGPVGPAGRCPRGGSPAAAAGRRSRGGIT